MPIGKLVNTIADFETSLASKVIVGATTATLTSATDDDGIALPSGTYGFTIDRKTSSKKEFFTADLVGTSLTNVKSVKRGDGSETTGFAIEHRQGSEVIISDYVSIKRIQDVLETGYATDPSPVSDFQLATKKYVDDTAFGGVSVVDKVVIVAMAGETVAAGNVVYLKGADSRWWLADARTSATCENVILGIAQGAATAGANITGGVLIAGQDGNQTGLTANTVYYVSDTPGALSSTVGTKEVTVGLATATTKIMFSPTYNQQLTEDQQDALVGSQGIPNSSNKYVTQDNIYTAETDQTQTTQNDVTSVGEVNATTKYNKLYQSFIPTKTKIRGVKLYKTADTGTFTGTVTVALKADSAGSPTGAALGTVTISNANWLAASTGEFEAVFTSEYTTMTVGNLYWIEVSCSTADNSNHPNLGQNTAGGYANGSVKFWNITDSYTVVATIDLYFKTLQGIENQLYGITAQRTKVEVFTYSSTWAKLTNAKAVEVICIGAGGGGGSGSIDVPYNIGGTGGSGGGGGVKKNRIFNASSLGTTETVTIGAGGTGGVAITGAGEQNGNAGVAGGNSSFGSWLTSYGGGSGYYGRTTAGSTTAGGGGAGTGAVGGNGGATNSTGGVPATTAGADGIAGQGAGNTQSQSGKCAEYGGGAGGSGTTPNTGGSSLFSAPGGGGGGGYTTNGVEGGNINSYTAGGGGAGGAGSDNGSPGTNGTSNSGSGLCGTGAGGGGGAGTGSNKTGGTGGAGGIGAGGGGGGFVGCSTGGTSGAGGAGGRGEVIVITYF